MKPELYVARIDFEYNIGPYKENMVALFDSRDLTKEEANNEIKLYPQGYNKKISFMGLSAKMISTASSTWLLTKGKKDAKG